MILFPGEINVASWYIPGNNTIFYRKETKNKIFSWDFQKKIISKLKIWCFFSSRVTHHSTTEKKTTLLLKPGDILMISLRFPGSPVA
jgi:hypothetical protein